MTLVRGHMEDFCNLHLFLPLHFKVLKKAVLGGTQLIFFYPSIIKDKKTAKVHPYMTDF